MATPWEWPSHWGRPLRSAEASSLGVVMPGLRGYVAAVLAGRVLIAAVSLAVALDTRADIPIDAPVAPLVATAALCWCLITAAAWPALSQALEQRPNLVWVDTVVIVALMLAAKPWDSLVALPYGAFALLVPYVRPLSLAVAVGVTALASYAPKLLLVAVGWRHAHLAVPVNRLDWLTLCVGPIITGAVAFALCLLINRIRDELLAWEGAEAAATAAEAARARSAARRALAARLHETLSQAVRAIPLRFDDGPPEGVSARFLHLRDEALRVAARLRPSVQALARDLQDD